MGLACVLVTAMTVGVLALAFIAVREACRIGHD